MESSTEIRLPSLNEVVVFRVNLQVGATAYEACEGLLGRDEVARADRLLGAELRRRFVVCRAALRRILAAALGGQPEALRFGYERWGKPHVAGSAPGPVHFNVSHSGEQALIGLAGSPIGVDVELRANRLPHRAIVRQVLSDLERAAWEQLPASQRLTAAVELWVCKEALLKAMGLGIAEGLQEVSLPLPIPQREAFPPQQIEPSLQMHIDDDGTCRATGWTDARTWRVRLLPDLLPDHVAALATARHIHRVTFQNYALPH